MTTIKPRVKTVHIYQGDYDDRIAELKERIETAQQQAAGAGPRLLSDPLPAADLIAEHDALVAEAKAEAITVKVRNLGRRSYHELKVKHPPREDKDGDKSLGCNEDTFFDELITMSLLEPQFKDATEVQRFLEDLAPIDWEKVKWAAFSLNEVATADPKLFPASKPTQQSDET